MAEHGTISRYRNQRCRCPECRTAQARALREHRSGARVPFLVADYEAMRDLLNELAPDGLTSPDERERHDELIAQ